jgi:hypothetical protein
MEQLMLSEGAALRECKEGRRGIDLREAEERCVPT